MAVLNEVLILVARGFEETDRGWDSEMRLLPVASGLPSEPVLVQGQVVFGRDSASAQEAALALASLLEGEV